MTIGQKEYVDILLTLEMCIERIKKLEAAVADHEERWRRYAISDEKTLDLIEIVQREYKNQHKHISMIYGVVDKMSQVVFPERHVKGIKPDFLVNKDPEKLV